MQGLYGTTAEHARLRSAHQTDHSTCGLFSAANLIFLAIGMDRRYMHRVSLPERFLWQWYETFFTNPLEPLVQRIPLHRRPDLRGVCFI